MTHTDGLTEEQFELLDDLIGEFEGLPDEWFCIDPKTQCAI